MFLAFQYPTRNSGRGHDDISEGGVERAAPGPRRGRSHDAGIHAARARGPRARSRSIRRCCGGRSTSAFPAARRRGSRFCRWLCWRRGSASSTRPTSGLDIDALRVVAEGVNGLRDPKRAFLVITHYQRLLDYIEPDVVHVMAKGRIVATGGPELALELERTGYRGYAEEAA